MIEQTVFIAIIGVNEGPTVSQSDSIRQKDPVKQIKTTRGEEITSRTRRERNQ